MKNTLQRILHFLPVILVLFTAVVLTACSSGGGTTSKTTATSSISSVNTVTLANFAFSPATLNVQAGTTVTWTNKDSTTHTVTSDSGVFDSGNLAPNTTFNYTFNTAGTFAYHCAIHPSMTGKVVVK